MAKVGKSRGKRSEADLTVTVFRAVLTAGVAGTWPDPDISDTFERAAAAAAQAARHTYFVDPAIPSAAASSATTSSLPSNDVIEAVRAHQRYAFEAAEDSAIRYADDASAVHSAIAARTAAFAEALVVDVSAISAETSSQIFRRALFPDESEVHLVVEMWISSRDRPDPDNTWSFWREWYQGFLDGKPMDWELQRRVALIPNDVWEAGPEAVANAIQEIRRHMVPKPLDQKKLATHMEELLASPDMSELAAESAAQCIEKSIYDFKIQAPSNRLPDGLEPLEEFPKVFRSIKLVIASSRSRDKKIAAVQEAINNLHAKVQRLETELTESQDRELTGVFKKTYIEALAATLGSAWFKGALCLGTCHFFGVAPSDITFENLRSHIERISNAAPIHEAAHFSKAEDL